MKTYTTSQCDTWDSIAFKLYRDCGAEMLTDLLIDYNEKYIDYMTFPANVVLNIPEISQPIVENLPPWKR